MLYKALYLPVDKPLEDGCDVINSSGERFIYDAASDYWRKDAIRRSELFLVSYEFNQIVVIGRPSPEVTWLKNGMDVKECDCQPWEVEHFGNHGLVSIWKGKSLYSTAYNDEIIRWRIKCPTCQILH